MENAPAGIQSDSPALAGIERRSCCFASLGMMPRVAHSMLAATGVYLLGFCAMFPVVAAGQSEAIQRKTTLGPVTATVALDPAAPVIGDVLELTVTVVAQPEVEVLMPEFGEALGRFQIADFLPEEKLSPDGETVYTQRYRLLSPASGDYAIPPILVEFVDRRPGERESPDGLDAYELFTERIPFTVESVLVDDATADLNPPLGKIDEQPVESAATSWNWGYLVVALLGLAAVGTAVLAVIGYRRRVIRKSAYEIARRQLDQLLASEIAASDRIDQFYVELTGIVRKYLENRFDLRAPELTTEEFLNAVADSAELTSDHKRLLNDFLKHADLVKFARLQPTQSDVDESVARANRFLEETRENAPLLVDPETVARGPSPNRAGADDV